MIYSRSHEKSVNKWALYLFYLEQGDRLALGAKEWFFLADPIDARQFFDLGMVNRIVPLNELKGEVASLAERLATGPGRAYGMRMGFGAVLASRSNETKRVSLDRLGHKYVNESQASLYH